LSTHSELARDMTEHSFSRAWTTILAERQGGRPANIASAVPHPRSRMVTRFSGLSGRLWLHANRAVLGGRAGDQLRAGGPAGQAPGRRIRADIPPCKVRDRFRKRVDIADERPRILAA
jgi:hypothetical protein